MMRHITAIIKNCAWCACFTAFTLAVQAQVITVPTPTDAALSGIALSSATGQPLPGISVTIPGVASSITDDDGRFSLRRTVEGAVIQFRGQGYACKEVIAGSQTDFKVELHDESFRTVYRQVITPFGRQDWKTVSASVSTIPNKENYKKAIVSSESLIQDEGLGVNTLMRSGAPGAGGNMFVRGFTSIYATNQPMILIDGVPYENTAVAPSLVSGSLITPLTGIDVKDIENITILKDATSIYGSKGANGAILIETAKASGQATRIDFHTYASFNQTSDNLYPMMNAWQYKSYLNEILCTRLLLNGDKFYTQAQIQALPYINQEKPVTHEWGIEGNRDYYRYNQDTDWQKEVFQNSVGQNYYVSIKGGDDIALYALSVGALNHGGIVRNTNFSRYNTQFNAQIDITSWLKMNSNMNFSYGSRQLSCESESSSYNPIHVSLIKMPMMGPYVYNELGLQTPNYEQADVFDVSNPAALVDPKTSLKNINYRFFGNIGAIAELGKNVDLGLTLGVIFDKVRENIFLPETGLYHEALPNGVVTNESNAAVSRYFQYYAEPWLGYRRNFDRKHSVSGKLGFRYQTNRSENGWMKTHNSSSDDMKSVGMGKLDMSSTSGVIGDWKWLSFYLNGEYGYLNRYFLSLNMAMDGSSRFGKDASGINMGGNIFGVFPSITGAWLISSESFMKDMKIIEQLKLRLGYSLSGNDDIGNYSARMVYVSQNFLGYNGLVPGNIVSQNLKWETVARVNAGVDAALFNERLSFSFDIYQSKTTDLLSWRESKDYTGTGSYVVNDGTMQNRGFELGVYGRIINRELKWDMGINAAHYKNKVTALSVNEMITQIGGAGVLTRVGDPVGLFYGYKTNGVYATSAEAAADGLHILRGDGTLIPFQAGDVRFVNMNSDNIIDEKDMTVIGDPNPVLTGSIVNRLQWKRLALNVVFTYSCGNDVYNAVRASVESMSGPENQTLTALNRWNREGHLTSVPRAVWDDPMGNARFSDRWIEDGSYIRLKSLSLSYDIPLPARLNFISGLQIYVTANNLLTFTKYLGYDPEFSALQSPLAYGMDLGMTPMPRAFLFGIKLGL